MNNFQLYRTNLFLGGQMKWDLIVDSNKSDLYVSDFHLSPISRNIPFVHKSNEILINNSHCDNVKAFYKSIKGNFYNPGLDAEYSHIWPIISDDSQVNAVNVYSDTFDMGCRRAKHYDLYGKQLEFFCPVWLEHLSDDDILSFKISVYTNNTNKDKRKLLSSNTLCLKQLNDASYHNKFVNYFKEHIATANINVGNDRVMNVIFNENSAAIDGLNVDTGIMTTRSLNTLVGDILNRERPLIEVDNMLIQSFVNNTIICNQLFNFNICFDIEDIIPAFLVKEMLGDIINVSIDVFINDRQIECKDFYTEYDHINRHVTVSNDIEIDEEVEELLNSNVLDYLHDNACVDLIDKNKFSQDICHWALTNNNDYIFNVYNGFSGLCIDNANNEDLTIFENDHQYNNSPKLDSDFADKNNNAAGWINTIEIDRWSDFYAYIKKNSKIIDDGLMLNTDMTFINNVLYSNVPEGLNNVSLLGVYTSPELYANIYASIYNTNYDVVMLSSTSNNTKYKYNLLCYMFTDDITGNQGVMFITDNINALSFKVFSYILDEYLETSENETLNSLSMLIHNKVDPKLVVLNNSLKYYNVAGPNVQTQEISYCKDNNTSEYVMRYDGNIKPCFTDRCDTIYYKDVVTKENIYTSKYAKYVKTKFDPRYPSIDYCAINKLSDVQFDSMPMIRLNVERPLKNTLERSWFNDNTICALSETLTLTTLKPNLIYHIDELTGDIIQKIRQYYKIQSDDVANYIASKYNKSYSWDVADNGFIYKVDFRFS